MSHTGFRLVVLCDGCVNIHFVECFYVCVCYVSFVGCFALWCFPVVCSFVVFSSFVCFACLFCIQLMCDTEMLKCTTKRKKMYGMFLTKNTIFLPDRWLLYCLVIIVNNLLFVVFLVLLLWFFRYYMYMFLYF